jgi:hypothetical protein
MSTIKKTIQINPELFSLGSNKTRKNRENKEKTLKPFISPNILKNKLLKRIKEHKRKENDLLEKENKTKIDPASANNHFKQDDSFYDINKYTDEFNDSIQYLQTISKQKKIDNEKEIYEKKLQKRREELQNKTLRNTQSYDSSSIPYVNIDLPEDLREPLISVTTEQFNFQNNNNNNNDFIRLREQKQDNIPYGILKGGVKPTYREWNKTKRNMEVTDPNSAMILTDKEKRLHLLKEKIKQKKILTAQNNIIENKMLTEQLIHKPSLPSMQENLKPHLDNDTKEYITNHHEQQNDVAIPESISIPETKILKRTIRRKYLLGKSCLKKSVGILIKDRFTRKKILYAQKELKKKPIQDVKKYLREHNLIKIGTNAPNDVIRKIYESAMLTGEITNNNEEILLHNFVSTF